MPTAIAEYGGKLATDEEIIADVCRASYEDFVRHFWDTVPSSQPLVWNWHMSVICAEMQTPAERVFASQPCQYDSGFNMPFGTSKSSLCSILFQPWTWTRMPQARHMTGTHTEPLGADLAGKSMAVIESDLYKECFPEIKLVKRSDSHFTNEHGGERRICTVGGKTPTGFHAHFLGVDDPIDPKGAMSEAELSNAASFMTNVLPSRKVTPKEVPWTYIVAQRLGKGDPTEVMIKHSQKEGTIPFRRVCLPGELSDDVWPPELKGEYIDGLLDPVLLPRRMLNDYRARGSYFYASQVMQNPLALGGGMFKEHYFNRRLPAAPYEVQWRIRYWDRAATDQGGCATAGVLMSYKEGIYYVEHCVHGHWEPDERNQRMRACALRDRNRYGKYEPEIWVEREGGSSGRDAWKGVVRALEGFYVREDTVTGSKDRRAEPWSSQCAAGNVVVIDDGTWDVNGYIEEHCLFKPTPGKRIGSRVDRVDASDGAFNIKVNARMAGSLYVVGPRGGVAFKKGCLRIVVCSREELESLMIEDHPCILVFFEDPRYEDEGEESAVCGQAAEKNGKASQGGHKVLEPLEKTTAVTGGVGMVDQEAGKYGLTKLLDLRRPGPPRLPGRVGHPCGTVRQAAR